MSRTLEPLRFPFEGSRLIEASAGTGKTFTLALLYTRLVLGHETRFGRDLTPSDILVLTFTEAATQELRDRIRARLVEASALFESRDEDRGKPPSGRDPMRELRAAYPPEAWPGCARRLRLAAEAMDEAVISTIHGWCNRMLAEHAFDTRGLFDRELVTDQSDLVAEVLRDYWRAHFYPLEPDRAEAVLEVAGSPEALGRELSEWIRRRDSGFTYKGEPLICASLDAPLSAHLAWSAERRAIEAECAELETELHALEDRARAAWRADRAGLESLLRDLRPHLNGTSHDSAKPDKFDQLLRSVADWSEGAQAPGKLKNFAQGAFSFKKTAKVRTEPVHAAFQAIADWTAADGARPVPPDPPEPPLKPCLLAHAAAWVRRELDRRLRRRAEMGFDDLLRQLDSALDPDLGGDRAAHLAETIRRQFPVALIDEFQDTDPIQYRIFDRIYRVAKPHPGSALVMIGDPKQAIYGFRGADIHAYLAARSATEGRHDSLDTNYRATKPLVAACNQLFKHAEKSWDRGAFRFRNETGENPIPFEPVLAKGRPERLRLDGSEPPALTFWTLDAGEDPVSPETYRRTMAETAATRIVDWLSAARRGQAGFAGEGGFEPLRPRDIAILVRTGQEAALMREALAERQVPSVYLSDRDSVLETREAADLLHWLRACAAPGDEGLVRAALGTNTLAVPLAELARLQDDELEWEEQVERFGLYQRIWRRQGVLAMLHRLMQDLDLPARLVGRADGERILTNLLHLAEWLQSAATAIDGEQALIRHLAEQLGSSDSEQILRLESDAELIQVVTIHKSKGLEYPLVLLPFICGWKEVDGRRHQVPYRHDGQTYLEIAAKSGFAEAWQAADEARLSEDMRLLYVAFTRARHAIWAGIAPLKSGRSRRPQLEKSAIGHLLGGGAVFEDPQAVWEALGELKGKCKDIRIEPVPTALAIPLQPEDVRTLDRARPAPEIRLQPWWIASYSALRRGAGAETGSDPTLSAETAEQETAQEESANASGPAAPTRDPAETGPSRGRLHDLPAGGRYGTFLHGILEWAADQRARTADGRLLRGYAAAAESDALRREMLGRRCNLRDLERWIDPLDAWLSDLLGRTWRLRDLAPDPADPPELALRDLEPERMQVEMEFWLPSLGVDTRRIDRLALDHIHPGIPRPALAPHRLNGMLKGFVDLVFEHRGRYYLADWKSNKLGDTDADYGTEAMRAAILEERYDLQYLLYLLALHRQLKARLPGYDYERHVGGAIYVFLRGTENPSQGLYMDRPGREAIETLDALFAGGRATEGGSDADR
ncbi:exodeoxyribonuclease V subunit beta [Imhoffiella purpurea]|uniref:RecBCD enzyme subunit RecB n=1 Tax=Imhoffiella purpurea TaxID=1249627 RepID=W9VAU0_9GAMM|nr:exodeoxyribonuclease V subunit beta [Imhoffiella purpurea]EXJ16723.1 Exodeoxyribonuclease V beta chain [Imhoffiella purpurea]